MAKILFVCISIELLSSIQSASFQCDYKTSKWDSSLDTIYHCDVQNFVSITTLDAAQVDSISGSHLVGYNNDKVEGFRVNRIGQIHYFPRGLKTFFKNLRAIRIEKTGLKELHQSDLKDFPKLNVLWLYGHNLEILEENLFEFNPNLEFISLHTNNISHIDLNVFDKLIKLSTLSLNVNICTNMVAYNPTAVLNIIKAAKDQCTNSVYSNLEQKVKNLEIESVNLNSEIFKQKLEKLENEIKSSKFSNTFQRRLQDLKAAQVKKAQETITTPKAIITKTQAPKESENSKFETCSALETKLAEIENKLEENEDKDSKSDQKITEVDEKVSKLSKDMSTALKDIESANNQNFAAILKFIENLNSKMEAIEEKLSGIDDAQKKLMNKIHKIESESNDNQVKVNQKLRAILKAV